MTKHTAYDVVDLDTGVVEWQHVKGEISAEVWASFLKETLDVNAVVVEHWISATTCPKCIRLVDAYKS